MTSLLNTRKSNRVREATRPRRKELLFGVVVLCALILASKPIVAVGATLYEDVRIALAANEEVAYQYAVKHFDAAHADDYDIDRAAVLFDRVYAMNPNHPYVQHQRARVAFLRSDFSVALMRIDEAVEKGTTPSSYYMRGLIKGFMGDYEGAAKDYEMYLRTDPKNWAAITDYSWVLIKAGKPLEGLVALDWGLLYWPDNPWLLNTKATAHFDRGEYIKAKDAIMKAKSAVDSVTPDAWSRAYPGNDPLIAPQGVDVFRKSVEENMHRIDAALQREEINVP